MVNSRTSTVRNTRKAQNSNNHSQTDFLLLHCHSSSFCLNFPSFLFLCFQPQTSSQSLVPSCLNHLPLTYSPPSPQHTHTSPFLFPFLSENSHQFSPELCQLKATEEKKDKKQTKRERVLVSHQITTQSEG